MKKAGRKLSRARAATPRAKRPGRRPWSEKDLSILRRLYRTRRNSHIARALGRTVAAVLFKAHRMGLSKGIRRLRQMGRENVRLRWQRRDTQRRVPKSE